MPIISVKVIEGFFTEDQKRLLITKLTDAFCAATFEGSRPYIYVTIEEIKHGHWGLGGRPLPDVDFLLHHFAPMVEQAAVEIERLFASPKPTPPPSSG